MRTTAILAALIFMFGIGGAAAQGTYSIDTIHSFVGFKVRHLVSKTVGEFTSFSGTIVADFNNLDGSSVGFTIDAASIDTRDAERDDHSVSGFLRR